MLGDVLSVLVSYSTEAAPVAVVLYALTWRILGKDGGERIGLDTSWHLIGATLVIAGVGTFRVATVVLLGGPEMQDLWSFHGIGLIGPVGIPIALSIVTALYLRTKARALAAGAASVSESPAAPAPPPPTPAGKPFRFRATGGVHTLPGAIELADGSVVIANEAQAELRSRLRSERDYAANYKLLRREMQQKIAAAQRAAEDDKAEADALGELFAKVSTMTPDERFEWAEEFSAEVPKLRLEIAQQKLERERAALREERNPTPTAEEATEARQEVLQSELRATYTRVMAHDSVKVLPVDQVNAVFRKHAARLERLVSKEADGSEVFDDAEVLEDLEILLQAAATKAAQTPAPTNGTPRSPAERNAARNADLNAIPPVDAAPGPVGGVPRQIPVLPPFLMKETPEPSQ